MRTNPKTADPLRMYTGYNHTVPIAGRRHDVQTEFLAGNPAKIVSYAFLSGRVISSLTQEVAREDLEDEFRVRELIKSQQKETIRQLVVAARAQRPEPVPPPAPSPQPEATMMPGEEPLRVEERVRVPNAEQIPFADIEIRQVMVGVARAAQRPRPGSDPLADLAYLVGRCAPICSDAEGTRSSEMASLLLLRADAKACLQEGDSRRAAQIVDELQRLARGFIAVNDREALQAHDHREWRRHLERLQFQPEDASTSSDELKRLRMTWGRDEALDNLLDDPRNPAQRHVERSTDQGRPPARAGDAGARLSPAAEKRAQLDGSSWEPVSCSRCRRAAIRSGSSARKSKR